MNIVLIRANFDDVVLKNTMLDGAAFAKTPLCGVDASLAAVEQG
ncbi:hypothetical protein ACIQVN_32615 [Streptomyces cyaneofuscatus]